MPKDIFKSLRILHVSSMAQVMVHFKLPLLKALGKAGASQTIYCSNEQYCMSREASYCDGGHLRMLLDLGYNVKEGPLTRRLSFMTIHEIISLYLYLRENKYDVVAAHQPVGALIAIPAARLAGVPVKIYYSGGLRGMALSDSVIHKHGENLLVRLSDAVMLNNMEDFEYVKALRYGAGKAHFVGAGEGCGVSTDIFNRKARISGRSEARHAFGLKDDETVVGFVGRYVWEKGFRQLIEAAAIIKEMKYHNVRYLIVGHGPDEASIKDLVARTGLEKNFIFAGYHREVYRVIPAFDLFVLPSFREGLPTSLLQAMAMGLPCVATDIRGSRELIEDGINGVIVPVGSSVNLANSIAGLFDDPDKAEKLGLEAEKQVRAKYSEQLLLPRNLNILRQIIGDRLGNA